MPSLPAIPASILKYIQQASSGTGIPQQVVAAQNYVESSYGTNLGPSSAGAEGPWQFEPYTWSGLTSQPFSDANNWADSTPIYINYMNQLLKEEGGDIRNALAAYNAGPGNLSAGYGYADGILALAFNGNVPTGLKAGKPGTTPAPSDTAPPTGGGGGGNWLSWLTDPLTAASDLLKLVEFLINPMSWLRIIAGFAGFFLLFAGLIVMAKAA